MLQGFKDFIARGSVIDLAVGVVIGAAFGAVVTALVEGVLNPLIAAIFGHPNLDSLLAFTINGSTIQPGLVLTALINFLLVAAAIYFAVVLPMNKLAERRARGEEPEPVAPAEDVALLTEIRDLLATKAS
ncbi:large conductance mechanosensitive channel protein MscL [Ruania rhizosphaerae]|uniref:large conductance mechanosensitive channel protein MscL n=1 Tax=Ruania rhizosphaerae TaxID=1840413 RepID=UPI001359F197|nr:large conductance mechanosensitive channel protein MscL [Ruania rhizosphaerae]